MKENKNAVIKDPRIVGFFVLLVLGFIILFAFVQKASAHDQKDYHTEWSSWSKWEYSNNGECQRGEDAIPACGPVKGTKEQWRKRICKLTGGKGRDECQTGPWQYEYRYETCEIQLPACNPEPTPRPGLTDPGPGSAPVCTDLSTILLPLNFHIIRNGAVATLKWVPTQGDQVNVFYKENGQPGWTHALGDQTNDGYLEIGGLNPSLGYTFGLMQKNGCSGGQVAVAVVIDPPSRFPRIFKLSHWEWLN